MLLVLWLDKSVPKARITSDATLLLVGVGSALLPLPWTLSMKGVTGGAGQLAWAGFGYRGTQAFPASVTGWLAFRTYVSVFAWSISAPTLIPSSADPGVGVVAIWPSLCIFLSPCLGCAGSCFCSSGGVEQQPLPLLLSVTVSHL